MTKKKINKEKGDGIEERKKERKKKKKERKKGDDEVQGKEVEMFALK